MSHSFERSIEFVIENTKNGSDLLIKATEVDGTLVFDLNILESEKKNAELKGLYFDLNDLDKLVGIQAIGDDITQFESLDIKNFRNGTNINGKNTRKIEVDNDKEGYNFGIDFGTPGKAKDFIESTSFTLANELNNLTLDDIANVNFAAALGSSSSKLHTYAPAAPDATDDVYNIFEDSSNGLDDPSTVPVASYFEFTSNDTDADGDVLTIMDFHGISHGTVERIDNDGDGNFEGINYTPDEDFSGVETFYYSISDNDGGTDFAQVTINVEAVADIPDLSYEILEGSTVNELIVKVTATQTDADGSEFIDRILLDGIPADVTVLESIHNPLDEPDQIVKEFKFILPKEYDNYFDLGITAVSKEESNGDEEINRIEAEIEYETTFNDISTIFEAKDQSMWSSGDALTFSDDRFLGVDSAIDERVTADAGVANAFADVDIDYKLGFQSDLKISGGEVDATAPYSVDINSYYNKSTDWLRFESDAFVKLNESVFDTQSPYVDYTLELITELSGNIDFGVGVDIPGVPGTPAVEVEGVTVIPAIPGIPGFKDSWSTTADAPTLDLSPTLLEFSASTGNTLNLFGLQGDGGLTHDLGKGFYLTAIIPDITTTSSSNGSILQSSGSSDFFHLGADIDDIVTTLAGFPVNPLGDSVSIGRVEIYYDVLDYKIFGSVGVGQEFEMDFGDINGTITFEDDSTHSFVLGDDFDIHNISEKDANGDKVIEYGIELDPSATFQSNLLLTLGLNHRLQVLKAGVSIDVPVFEDPNFSLGPVYDSGQIPLAQTSIDIVGLPEFNFDLGNVNYELIA